MTAAHPRTRRLARERAVQFLYGLHLTRYDWVKVLDDFWTINPARPSVKSYAEKLIRGVVEHTSELDEHIHAALDRWTPERVGPVERAVLRVALYEMMHVPDVPAPVAINEALEVSRRYGSEEAPRFVNGVLDRLQRNWRERNEQSADNRHDDA